MKRLAFLVAAAALLLWASPALAGKNGPAGKSNVAHLYLYEKNQADWTIVDGGAWGKMKYNQAGSAFEYVFNGHELEPNTAYSLIYYADPWPGNNPGALIASGVSNADGNVHLSGSTDLNTDLPNPTDDNYPPGQDGVSGTGDEGAKIWLVLSSDYNAGSTTMTGWNPTEYLFEYDLIQYNDTDL